MDGNGRWATRQNLKRTAGHKRGAEVVRQLSIHLANIKIPYLTLYAFSTENWKRPEHEVNFLIKLIDTYLKKELSVYLENNVRFNVIGDISKFSKNLKKTIKNTLEKTKHCNGMTQTLAINYGSKDEILRTLNHLLSIGKEEITEEDLNKTLDTKDMPEVDMLIRTGGEKRLSNFLLWQSAYAELFFTDTLWPDFTSKELDSFINDFQKIHRRFGTI